MKQASHNYEVKFIMTGTKDGKWPLRITIILQNVCGGFELRSKPWAKFVSTFHPVIWLSLELL